jgi:hypothetical protein
MRRAPAGGLIAASIIASLMGGCAFLTVPVPSGHGVVRSGTMVPEAATRSLRVGETRRSEVLAQLGPPARRFEDLRIDVYGWADVSWYFPWMFAIGGYGGGWATGGMAERWQRHILAIRYDPEDRVQRIGFRVCGGNQTIGECVHAWAEKGSPIVRAAAVEPRAVLNVWNASSKPGVEILIDGELAAELASGTWTPIEVRPGMRVVTVRPRAAPWVKSSLSDASACVPQGGTSFALRMTEGHSYEVEAGIYQHPDALCPWVRWGVRRPADGVEARRHLRKVW